MKLFIQNLDITFFIFNFRKILSCSKLFYIDGNLRLINFIEKFSIETEKVQFRLIDVKNSKGILTRLEIPNNLLNPDYKKFLEIFKKSNSFPELRYTYYLVRSSNTVLNQRLFYIYYILST